MITSLAQRQQKAKKKLHKAATAKVGWNGYTNIDKPTAINIFYGQDGGFNGIRKTLGETEKTLPNKILSDYYVKNVENKVTYTQGPKKGKKKEKYSHITIY